MNIVRRRIRVVTDQQAEEFAVLYAQGISAEKVARQFGVSRKTVTYHLTRQGIGVRPAAHLIRAHSCNERYFSTINTEEKAYWLGFLTADGYVNRSGGNYAVALGLGVKDAEHVRWFASCIGSDAPIFDTKERPATEKWGIRTGAGVRVMIYSKALVEDLAQLGLGPCKSQTVVAWDGPMELMRHYWRGVFDGDGCICFSGNRWHISLCGSEHCMKSFKAFCGTNTTPHLVRGTWYLQMSGRPQVRRIIQELYGNCTIALPRKLALAQEVLSEKWAHRPPLHNKNTSLDGQMIRNEYEAGASAIGLSRKYGVDQSVIARLIREAGGTTRTRHEAQKIYFQKQCESV